MTSKSHQLFQIATKVQRKCVFKRNKIALRFSRSACLALRKHNGRERRKFPVNQITETSSELCGNCLHAITRAVVSWVVGTFVELFLPWEKVKAIQCTPVCYMCGCGLHTNDDSIIGVRCKQIAQRSQHVHKQLHHWYLLPQISTTFPYIGKVNWFIVGK